MFKYYFYLCRPQTKNCPLNGNSRAEEKATAVWLCQTILQGKIKHNAFKHFVLLVPCGIIVKKNTIAGIETDMRKYRPRYGKTTPEHGSDNVRKSVSLFAVFRSAFFHVDIIFAVYKIVYAHGKQFA